MRAVWFRFIDQDGEPTGFVGMVAAHTAEGLFWAIDEFGDPYAAQIKTVKFHGGFCCKEAADLDDLEISSWESSEQMPFPDDEGWRTPKWVKDRLKVAA